MSAALFLAVGGAVLAPSLLSDIAGQATSENAPIVPYVTEAQSAAMSSLSAPILGVTAPGKTMQAKYEANFRYTSLRAALIPSRGALGAAKNYAALTADEAAELLSRFIAACLAGVAKGYRVVEETALGVRIDVGIAAELAKGERPDGFTYTDLGNALRVAALTLAHVHSPTFYDFDPIEAQAVAGRLAVEMDDQGYLITGEPWEPTITGGLGAAWDASVDFVVSVPGRVAGAASGLVGDIALSTPGLLLIGGLLVWKVVT